MAQQHSLLDFGPVMQAMQLGLQMENMDRARQREARLAENALIEQDQFDRTEALHQRTAAIQERNAEIEQQKARQTAAFRGFDEIEKLKNHPGMATNRARQVDLLLAQGALMEQGLGVKVPLPDRDELMSGYESVDKFVKAIQKGTPEERFAAATDAMAANPTWGKQILDDMKKAGDVSTQMEAFHAKMEENHERLEALKVKTGRMKMAENFFSEHSGHLGRVLMLPTDKNFAEDYRKVVSFKGDNEKEAKDIFLQQHPILKTEFEKRLISERPAVEAAVTQLEEAIDAKGAALREFEARGQQVPQEDVDEMAAMEAAYKARRTELNFIDNPYDKDAYKDLQRVHQDLRIRQSAAGKAIGEIANERTALMTRKYDDKQQATNDLAKAQIEFGQLPTEKQTPQNAAKIAGKYTGVLPQHVLEATKDPNKPGVSVTMTAEKEQAKEIGGYYGKQYAAIDKAGFDAVAKLNRLGRMESLLDQVQTGKLQPTKQKVQEFASALGFEVDESLPAAQALQSLTNEMALSLRVAGSGAMSDKDLEVLQSLPPNLSRTPEGNKFILESYKLVAKREQDVARLAREYVKKNNGQFDGGFQDYLADWAEKHPLFAGKKIPGMKEGGAATKPGKAAAAVSPPPPPSAGPFNDADKEARYQEWKRRQGK